MTPIPTPTLSPAPNAHPSVSETLTRAWNGLPSLWKTLLPALGALLVVLLPANLLISSQFYAMTTDNLRAQHRAELADMGAAFDDLFSKPTLYLSTLANNETIRGCAAKGCPDAGQAVFVPELTTRLKDPGFYYTELGFIAADGHETARAVRGSGGVVDSPGDGVLFTADPQKLKVTAFGQAYLFPIGRDTRISAVESYQQPVLRFAVPVLHDGAPAPLGYVTAVLNLDDFFAQNFVPDQNNQTLLLDTDKCLVASSDETRRAEIYKTWAADSARSCYADLELVDWDTTVQRYRDTVISTRVLHGPLATSGQTWTIVVQQPTSVAYAQANFLRTLLSAAQIATMIMVVLLVIAADRATVRLLESAHLRSARHARDIRFNPYIVGAPIEDPSRFLGRTQVMARVIGAGMTSGDIVLIDGDARIGKTSLLNQIARRLRDQRVPDPEYWYWPVLLSLEGVSEDVFYETLMSYILRDLPEHATRADLRYQRAHDEYAVADFREDIAELLALPNATERQTRLVICLDNVHLWLSNEHGYSATFVDDLRAMLNDVGNPIKLIGAGAHIGPEFNRSTTLLDPVSTLIPVGPLSIEEAQRLVRQPVGNAYRFDPEAVERIIAMSNRLPLEVQRLARYAVQNMLDQDAEVVSEAHVEKAVERALADWEPAYRSFWYGTSTGRLSEQERKTLLSLADKLPHESALPVTFWENSRVARARYDDVAYTDEQGDVRLTALFKLWLGRRSGKTGTLTAIQVPQQPQAPQASA